MRDKTKTPKKIFYILFLAIIFISASAFTLLSKEERQAIKEKEMKEMQEHFKWWPTDATPEPVKDSEREGYWWWPTTPGEARPWGNRGYVYVYKMIFDYKAEELPPPRPQELRPSLLIKKIIKNVKIYFDFDKADLRDDAIPILKDAVRILNKHPEADILITGNCDMRGSEAHNEKLGRRRAEAVKRFMLDKGTPEENIRIVSRGKLDAIAPLTDIVGMQKDRNAQFMIAEVEEIMLPYTGAPPSPEAKVIEEGKFIEEKTEKIETAIKVSTKDYIIKKGDTLWEIAQEHYGNGHRWKYLYEFNKDRIKNPNKLKVGLKIKIPIE